MRKLVLFDKLPPMTLKKRGKEVVKNNNQSRKMMKKDNKINLMSL
jgi:hypothetical protein